MDVDAKTLGGNWKVLWYHPYGEGSTRRPGAVKVDILLPGIMELPSFDPGWIDYNNEERLPAAPFSTKSEDGWDRINS